MKNAGPGTDIFRPRLEEDRGIRFAVILNETEGSYTLDAFGCYESN